MEMEKVSLLLNEAKKLYVSKKVFNFIKSFEKKDRDGKVINEALYKLHHLAKAGFKVDDISIKHEQHQVFRIRIMNTGRIIGFYDGQSFIAISWFIKKSQKLTKQQKNLIKKVGIIRKTKKWTIGIGEEYEI